MAKSINLYNKKTGKKLLGLSKEGSFPGELAATIGLLAYENGIEAEDVEVREE